MSKGNWSGAKTQALNVLRTVQRPPGISQRQWPGVKAFLYLVARGQPRFHKSQETIATEMGVSLRAVQNYVRWAKDAGLLEVWYDAGVKKRRSPSKTSRYFIARLEPQVAPVGDNSAAVDAADCAAVSAAQSACKGLSSTSVLLRQTKALSEGEQALPLESASRPPQAVVTKGRGTVSAVGRSEDAIERANAFGYKPVKPRKASRPDPAHRLVSHFCAKWEGLIERRPEFKDIRPVHTGAALGYFRNVFLSPKDGPSRSEADVEVLINGFMDALYRGKVKIKPGQTVFQCFTGSWHRTASTRQPYEQDVYEKFRRKHLGT